MKSLSLYLLSLALTASLLITGCTLDKGPGLRQQTIIPESFAVDIPGALSYTGGKKSAYGVDTLRGNDVYEFLRFFIKAGEQGAEIVEDIILSIARFQINKPMEVTYESGEDGRIKHLVVAEDSEYEGLEWEFQLTVRDVDSESNPDGGKALQIFWNRYPIKGIALRKPYNIDRLGDPLMGQSMFRIDYSEDNPFYDATMMVYVAGLPMPSPLEQPYAMKSMKMFAGKKGDIIDVYGNSDHPNAILISGNAGYNWAFAAVGDEKQDLGVAEVGLPPSNLDETSRSTLLGYYGLGVVFEREIKAVWGDLVPQQTIDAWLAHTEAPGYFDSHGFASAGTSPSSGYDELDSRLPDLNPFNPKEIGNLSLSFK
jgi:hypothetical protein